MALGFEIAGPVTVSIDPAGAVTVGAIGRTDGESLIGFDAQIHSKPIYTDEGGRVPQQVIHLGMTGLLTMQLIKWDRAVLNALWYTVPNAALINDANLNAGIVGRLWDPATPISGIGFFQVILTPDLADDQQLYTFGKCYLPEDGIRESNIGLDTTLLQLSFIVLPDGNNDLYINSSP